MHELRDNFLRLRSTILAELAEETDAWSGSAWVPFCGTGAELLLLCRQAQPDSGAHLFGWDHSEEVLKRARERLTPVPRGDVTISLTERDASEPPRDLPKPNVVVALFGFHLLGDPPRAVERYFESLDPGGKLIMADWKPPQARHGKQRQMSVGSSEDGTMVSAWFTVLRSPK